MGKSKYYKKLVVKQIPIPAECDHPEAPNNVLMKHEFSMGIIAPKGAGKTTLICNMLMMYKDYFHDIYIFSPTVLSDEKWDYIKKQKLIIENRPLKAWIKKEEQRRKGAFKDKIIQPPGIGADLAQYNTNEIEEFDGLIPEENFYDNYTEDDLEKILSEQKKIINALKKNGKTKYLADRILLIFDDLVGSTLFSMARDNLFKGFNTRHRHYSASVIMVSQGYKEIPRTIRTNWTGMIIFEIANDKEVLVIYEENTMGYKKDVWIEMFEYATTPPYSFMYLNSAKEKHLRCMMCFDRVLFSQKEEGGEDKFNRLDPVQG